jgi:hypothetical protein
VRHGIDSNNEFTPEVDLVLGLHAALVELDDGKTPGHFSRVQMPTRNKYKSELLPQVLLNQGCSQILRKTSSGAREIFAAARKNNPGNLLLLFLWLKVDLLDLRTIKPTLTEADLEERVRQLHEHFCTLEERLLRPDRVHCEPISENRFRAAVAYWHASFLIYEMADDDSIRQAEEILTGMRQPGQPASTEMSGQDGCSAQPNPMARFRLNSVRIDRST